MRTGADGGKAHHGKLHFKKRERIASRSQKRVFIDNNRDKFGSIQESARIMGINSSTYYYKPKKNPEKTNHDADIAVAIEAVAIEFPYYGYRRITAALRRKSIAVNHKKVAKIMKNMGIQCRKKKRFVSTTDSKHNLKIYPNLSKDLVVNGTDQLWCADITYIRILTGFVYLAAAIDAFS